MTLHWWMHWFWITRAVAAVPVLLLLLSAGTAAPLPPSTLHPDVQTGTHFSSALGSNWASALPLDYQEKASSVSSGPSEEVPFGASPVWTSSPEIEEPSDPTTVLSSGLSNVDIAGNIRVVSWFPPAHHKLPVAGENAGKEHFREFNVVDLNGEESIPWTEPNGPDVLTEPRALPLEAASSTLKESENHTIPIHTSIRNIPPKNLNNDSSIKITNILSKDTRNQSKIENTLSSKNSFAVDPNNESSGSEYVARLIPRDLRNVSESELPSEATSHRNSSTQLEVYKSNSSQGGIHLNVRTSKSIGFFPPQTVNSHLLPNQASLKEPELGEEHPKRSSSEAGQASGEKREVGSDEKTLSGSSNSKQVANPSGDSVNIKLGVNKGSVDNVGTKIFPEDLEMSDSPYAPEEHINSSAHGTQGHVRVLKHTSANSSESVEDKKTDFETGNSKIPSDNHTKLNGNVSDSSVNVSDSTVSDKTHVNNKNKESTPLASTEKPSAGTGQNKKHMNGTQILNQTLPTRNGDRTGSNQDGDSSTVNSSRDSATYPSSSGVPVTSTANVTSTSNRADFGRAASHNYADEDDTTSTISVTPVSRVAALPSSGSRKGLDAASITGIALGIVVFAGLTGAVSFVLYRRRYLNKPQTLNDKCSNPDSSGYIDDSTLRENSEEMYSLDNDSFLNSLEAMTIQNYWTDNVKHTKL